MMYFCLLLAEAQLHRLLFDGLAKSRCSTADAIGLALRLRFQNVESQDEGRHSVRIESSAAR